MQWWGLLNAEFVEERRAGLPKLNLQNGDFLIR